MQVPKGCCLFFCVLSGFAFGRCLCSSSFSIRGFKTIPCCMSYSTTDETQVIGELMSSLGRSKFTILTKLLSQIRFLFLRVLGCAFVIIHIGLFILVFVIVVVVIII